MLVANKKRKENITEYILYMYQVENLIRAFNLDIDLIEERLIPSYQVDEKTKAEILDWYKNLLLMMEKEGIQKDGHLQVLSNLVVDVNQLHIKLMETEVDKIYAQTFRSVSGLLSELKQKNSQAKNDVELGIAAIYGFLLLKMQNKTISQETSEAVKRIGSWLSAISKLYKDYESGDLEF